MLHVGRCLRTNNFRKISKALMIESGAPFACLPESIALFELRQTECRSNVGQIVFEPRRKNFVIPRALRRISVPGIPAQAMQTHHPNAGGPLGIIRSDHPALAGRDVLSRVERKTREV